jgi:hypothetical protein
MLGESMKEPIETGIRRDGAIMTIPICNRTTNRAEYSRMLHSALMLLLREGMFREWIQRLLMTSC